MRSLSNQYWNKLELKHTTVEVIIVYLYFVVFKDLKKGIFSGTYDARWRVLAQYLAEKMNIATESIEQYEMSVINCLISSPTEKSEYVYHLYS